MDTKNVSLELMWRVIEGYGIKRDMLEKSSPTKTDISELYQLIKKTCAQKKILKLSDVYKNILKNWKTKTDHSALHLYKINSKKNKSLLYR